jgi:3-(3-hydroxy-phenyl)propionate hydroxylase
MGRRNHARLTMQLIESSSMTDRKSFDVVIVGAGPVGLTLANLLGIAGVRTLVLERNSKLEGEPRAVTLDDESLRTMQAAGLIEAVLRDVVEDYGVQYFDWSGEPLATILPTRQEYGYAKRNAFRQPRLVQTLYEGLSRFSHVDVRFGHDLTEFIQHDQAVHCSVGSVDGKCAPIHTSWLVACDGGRSRIRELCNVKLDGNTFAERWLIVDLNDRKLPLRHTRTYCDPHRPAIRLPGPGGSLRYEFMLKPGDEDATVLDESTFRAWISRRVPEDADLPLVRKAIYGFHARVATRWKIGRVLLAGDAAHLTPPFAGQGLNSGIRDATNLAWKLAAVIQGRTSALLMDSYEQERRPHATALIGMALRIGRFMQPKTLAGAIFAQTALRTICLIPSCRDYVLQLKFKPKPRFNVGFFKPSATQAYAELLPQPTVQLRDGHVTRLDDVLGEDFAVLGWDSEIFRASALGLIPDGMRGRAVAVVRRDNDFLPTDTVATASYISVRDSSGALAAFLDQRDVVAVVVRPDRYVYRFLDECELTDPLPASGGTDASEKLKVERVSK